VRNVLLEFISYTFNEHKFKCILLHLSETAKISTRIINEIQLFQPLAVNTVRFRKSFLS